jgi:hypothetical protein
VTIDYLIARFAPRYKLGDVHQQENPLRPHLLATACLSLVLATSASAATSTSATLPFDKQNWYRNEKLEKQYEY